MALLIEDPPSPPCLGVALFHSGAGLALAVPFVVRNLGDILPTFLAAAATSGLVGAAYLGARHAPLGVDRPELGRLIDVGAILAIVFLLMPARDWLRTVIARVAFRRGRLRWAEIHRFLQTLSPEAGVVECCERTLAELARVMQLRSAAVLLHDGQTIVHGTLDVERLARLWPRAGAGALPARAFGPIQFRDLSRPLAAALVEAGVVGVVPVESPRRRWGHVLVTTDLLGASFSEEDDEAVDVFASQLALVLDGAELLARAVAVERSLAHAERLAAIGEVAARIAHEIRNPVTAARSLAQQVGREPNSPLNGEHAEIIVTELERVERQVKALLRFARREAFEFAAVDVGGLVHATVLDCRERLGGAGIRVDEDLADGVIARADREKLRQVLLNLIDNAVDALGEMEPSRRRLALSVRRVDGTAVLRITDSGPGVPAATLPHLFEPFFSLKTNGTGLGLAIAKRTIEAHAGRIEAESPPDGGLAVGIALPLAAGERPPPDGAP
jgi:signal transduction histidine kinase